MYECIYCILTKEFQSYHWLWNILPCSDANILFQGVVKGVSVQKNGIMQVSRIDVSLKRKSSTQLTSSCTCNRLAQHRVVQGYSCDAWLADIFFCETWMQESILRDWKAFCVTCMWRTWIVNRYPWFYHSILREFKMQVLQMVRRVIYREWLRYTICINYMKPWLSHSWIFFLQAHF